MPIEGSWMKWQEPLLSSDLKPGMVSESSLFKSPEPMDMTNLTHFPGVDPTRLSTFAFYEAKLSADHFSAATELTVKCFERWVSARLSTGSSLVQRMRSPMATVHQDAHAAARA